MQQSVINPYRGRRYPLALLKSLLPAFVVLAMLAPGPAAAAEPLRIGIIGTGKIGGALARHWARAGHHLVISSRHPDRLEPLAKELGPRVRTGTPAEAAEFGEVVLVSVPYGAMPQIGRDYASLMAGKVVLDTGNPFLGRDGPMAKEAQQKGAGIASAGFLPGVRLVRAFNCIPAYSLASQANREPERIAIPIASDHPQALAVARRLVDDAGFEAVVVGSLERSRAFDLGQPLAQGDLSAAELRRLVDSYR
jgi:predicted dinucleotide-binding enzyme